MGKTSIEWTDASWNPIVGCSPVSPGCANCYAERLAGTRLASHNDYKGLSVRKPGRTARWTGEIRLLPARLGEPEHWRRPRRIFVCDMGDLFHESVGQGALLCVFQAMANAPHHTYQILTKRAARMKDWLNAFQLVDRHKPMRDDCRWPWPNVWCGVSVENQHFADERIPLLLETPAAVRWISAEPLLGTVRLAHFLEEDFTGDLMNGPVERHCALNWVVAGGESGPNARPMHPDWVRALRDQCRSAGVPFFFKQWGAHVYTPDGFMKVTKKEAGRELDGREWNEFPAARP